MILRHIPLVHKVRRSSEPAHESERATLWLPRFLSGRYSGLTAQTGLSSYSSYLAGNPPIPNRDFVGAKRRRSVNSITNLFASSSSSTAEPVLRRWSTVLLWRWCTCSIHHRRILTEKEPVERPTHFYFHRKRKRKGNRGESFASSSLITHNTLELHRFKRIHLAGQGRTTTRVSLDQLQDFPGRIQKKDRRVRWKDSIPCRR